MRELPPDVRARYEELMAAIRPLLHGAGSEVQGAVLADLTSMWLAGHYPADIREPLLKNFVAAVRHLTPVNEAIIADEVAMMHRVKPQ